MIKKKILQRKKSGETIRLSVAWYKPEQWDKLLQISEDRDDLEETYQEWLAVAEKSKNDFLAQGVLVRKILVDVDELLSWCIEQGVPVNGESRSRYAGWVSKKMDKNAT